MKCETCRGACCEQPITTPVNPLTFVLERRWRALRDTPTGRCRELSIEGRCEIYGDRPLICKMYPVGGTDCLRIVRTSRTVEQYAAIRDHEDPLPSTLYHQDRTQVANAAI